MIDGSFFFLLLLYMFFSGGSAFAAARFVTLWFPASSGSGTAHVCLNTRLNGLPFYNNFGESALNQYNLAPSHLGTQSDGGDILAGCALFISFHSTNRICKHTLMMLYGEQFRSLYLAQSRL